MGAVAAAALVVGANGAYAGPLKVGDPFPSLQKAGLKGVLPDTAGKVVLVDFWASWCGPCKRSFPAMDALYRQFKDRGFVLLAISVDEKEKDMEQFLKDHPVSFPILHDARQKLAESAGIEAMPTSFLLDGKGKIVAVHKGFNEDETAELLKKEIEAQLGTVRKEKTP